MFTIQGQAYEVIENYREGWKLEAFRARYAEILARYDYIVGDWGYGQLRLKGFFDDSRPKVPVSQRISSLGEYLQEYCNFGCPYFVLKKVPQPKGGHKQSDAKSRHEHRS